MKNREHYFIFLLFLFITICFFYKTVFYGLIPFPGDLLVSNYAPWSTASYLGFLPGTIPNKGQYFDVIRQMYPWKTFVVETIKNGQLPLWNPYNFSGTPLLANIQSAVFYPFTLFYFLFKQPFAWTITVMLQSLLACFFTYLFARRIEMSRVASFFASIAFGFSLFTSVFLEYNTLLHVVVWLPFSLYAFEALLQKRKLISVILFVFGIALSFLAGHIQIAVLQTLFILAYGAFRIFTQKQKKGKKILSFLSFLVLLGTGIGIASIQLFPAFELLRESARVPQQYDFLIRELLLQPEQVFRIFSPDIFGNPANRNYALQDPYPGKAIYIGLIPLFFSFLALLFLNKKSIVRFLASAALVVLLLILRTPITEVFYGLQIPFFSTSSPGNAIFLIGFSLAILSGFGIDHWISQKGKKEWYAPVAFVFLLLFCFLAIVLGRAEYHAKSLLYSLLLLAALLCIYYASLFIRRKHLFAIVFVGITVLDLFYFFNKFNPFVKKELVFPGHNVLQWLRERNDYARFWGYGSGKVDANFATQYSIFSPDGYDPLYPKRYGELMQASEKGKLGTIFTNKTRSDAVIQPGFGEEDLANNKYRLKLLDLLGVAYIVSSNNDPHSEKTFPADRFEEIYSDGVLRIHKNKKSLPRVFLVSNYEVFKDKEEFERIFFADDFRPEKTVLLEERIDFAPTLVESGTAKITEYKANKLTIQTDVKNEALLFLSDTYFPGWEASVDGTKAHIYRANYAFRAITVPAGLHRVVFSYYPSSFSFGLKTSILCIALLFVLGLVAIKKKVFYES